MPAIPPPTTTTLPEAMPAIFEQHGLEVARSWIAANREEGVYLLTPEPMEGDELP